MKSEVLVRAREEEPDVQKLRQELTRSKSPTELSQINSLSDFPIPKHIEDLMAKKTGKFIKKNSFKTTAKQSFQNFMRKKVHFRKIYIVACNVK